MNLILPVARTIARMDFDAVATPRPGIGLSESQDKWLEAHPENKILDFGDNSAPCLLVGQTRDKLIAYALVPEQSPPGATVEQFMQHMRAAGMDVRGEGPLSPDGYKTVLVCERSH